MCLTFLEVYSYGPYLKLLICCGKCSVSKLRGAAATQTTLPSGTPDNWKESNNDDDDDDDDVDDGDDDDDDDDDDNKISNYTFCTFQIEIIVKVRAPTLNNKMSATGTPRTSRSALPFEIQQKFSAIEGGD